MQITKFKLTKDETVKIKYRERTEGGNWDKYSFNCNEEGRPELHNALDALKQDVVKICEFDEKAENLIKVTGVSFNYKHGIMGAVITAQKRLSTSNSPLNLNTPNIPEEPYAEGSEQPTLPKETVGRLETLIDECKLYIQGKRKQMSLFDDGNEQTDDLPGEPDFDEETGEVLDDEEPVGGKVVSRNFN